MTHLQNEQIFSHGRDFDGLIRPKTCEWMFQLIFSKNNPSLSLTGRNQLIQWQPSWIRRRVNLVRGQKWWRIKTNERGNGEAHTILLSSQKSRELLKIFGLIDRWFSPRNRGYLPVERVSQHQFPKESTFQQFKGEFSHLLSTLQTNCIFSSPRSNQCSPNKHLHFLRANYVSFRVGVHWNLDNYICPLLIPAFYENFVSLDLFPCLTPNISIWTFILVLNLFISKFSFQFGPREHLWQVVRWRRMIGKNTIRSSRPKSETIFGIVARKSTYCDHI